MKVAIIGCGSWGLGIGFVLHSNGHQLHYYTPFREQAQSLRETRTDDRTLKGVTVPQEWKFSTNLQQVLKDAELVVVAVPSGVLRSSAKALGAVEVGEKPMVVSLTKGVEQNTLLRMSQILLQEIPWLTRSRLAVLSGPSHAEEVARFVPTTVVVASASIRTAQRLQEIFLTEQFRVYTSTDVLGVELCGALKNVIAIATGMVDGLGLGDNTKGALLTRGLAEISRLGEKLGGQVRTFAGLAGMGDLITTCISKHSRNRYVGEELGKGRKLEDVLGGMTMVAEGVPTALSGYQLAQKHKVQMPITEAVYRTLYEEGDAKEELWALMKREPKPEGV